MHEGVRFSCGFCGKTYSREYLLKKHEEICGEKSSTTSAEWVPLPSDHEIDGGNVNQCEADAVGADGNKSKKPKLSAASEPAIEWEILSNDHETDEEWGAEALGGDCLENWSIATKKNDFAKSSISSAGDQKRNQSSAKRQATDEKRTMNNKHRGAIDANGNQIEQEAVAPAVTVQWVRFCTECGTKFSSDEEKCCGNCGIRRKQMNCWIERVRESWSSNSNWNRIRYLRVLHIIIILLWINHDINLVQFISPDLLISTPTYD